MKATRSQSKISKEQKEMIEELVEKATNEIKMRIEDVEKEVNEMKKVIKKVINDKDERLEEERCELEVLEALNSALLIKERQSSDELQEARKELIRVCMFIFHLLDLSG